MTQNIAILVALTVATQALARWVRPGTRRRAAALGALFGLTAVLGMLTPFRAAEGVIYDGRSIILGIAGLFGGPGAASIAALIAAGFRLFLGGAGRWVGVAVIAESAALGVAGYYHRRKTGRFRWLEALALAYVIHALMLALQLLLPGGIGPQIVKQIAAPVLIVYPVAMMLVAQLMLDQEERFAREEQLQALNASLERMVDQRTKELQAANEELERANKELARALAELDAASRSKSAFLRTMSHELRTPLNSVIGFADLLASGLAGPLAAEQRKQVEMIRDAGRHLLALVDQTLDLARIEAGKLSLSFQALDARDLAVRAVEALRPEAEAKGLDVRTELPDEPLPLTTDETRALEILMNLMGNAVKFTQTGSVTITARHEGDAIVFEVEDTGPGIAPEDLPRVFLEFVREPSRSDRRAIPGAGLGLAISKRLAEALGGELTARSEVGSGSTFTLRLPAAPPASDDRQS